MLTPRERTNSLRNCFPGEQNGVRQMMQICILMEQGTRQGDRSRAVTGEHGSWGGGGGGVLRQGGA